MTRRRVFLYVQHLLGIGHLKRALVIAKALSDAGLEVTVASGGHEAALLDRSGLHWVQLPSVGTADLSFSTLVDMHGQPIDEAWKLARARILLDAWERSEADVLLIELFPFGRRQMRFELLPLLEAAHARNPRPLILSSIRDVLGGGRSNPARQQQMLDVFDRWFDHLLVHGDPALIPLDATFALTASLGSRMHYTGYVVASEPAGPDDAGEGEGEVLVSAGGGAVGMALYEAALQARPLTSLAARTWRVLVGPGLPEAQFQRLRQRGREGVEGRVIVERARPDFVAMLGRCVLSISQGGYNTVLEALSMGTRCVLVPFAGGGEIEQSLRAELLARQGWVQTVAEAGLSAANLAAAVDRACLTGAPPKGRVRLDGAQRTAKLVLGWLEAQA